MRASSFSASAAMSNTDLQLIKRNTDMSQYEYDTFWSGLDLKNFDTQYAEATVKFIILRNSFTTKRKQIAFLNKIKQIMSDISSDEGAISILAEDIQTIKPGMFVSGWWLF